MSRIILLFMAAALTLTACGGESNRNSGTPRPTPTPRKQTPAIIQKPWNPSLGVAVIKGRVRFAGDSIPQPRPIDMSIETFCAEHHREHNPMDESLIVSNTKEIQNVFVWVKKGLEAWKFDIPQEAVLVDQIACVFRPRVFGVMAGQEILIRNSDDTSHNVHAISRANSGFNFMQRRLGDEDLRVFENAEIGLEIKCDLHAWMRTWVNVVPHPFYDVSGSDGTFELPALAPGTYEIEAWHEKLGRSSKTIRVDSSTAPTLEFELGP